MTWDPLLLDESYQVNDVFHEQIKTEEAEYSRTSTKSLCSSVDEE
jgi:hypothetical protein